MLFLDSSTPVRRPPVSGLAVASLIIAATGFVNIIGFFIGPVLAFVALYRLRGTQVRGRRLAIAALWISYAALAVAVLAILTFVAHLVVAYAQLPSPHFF